MIIDKEPPKLRLHYQRHIGLHGAIQGRATGVFPRTVDEIVDPDEDLQADMIYFNDLIEFFLREANLPGKG